MRAVGAVCLGAALMTLISWIAATDASHVARSRAARITTTACGDASRTDGAAIMLGGSSLLASAHVVIGAGSVSVDFGDGPTPAQLIGLDAQADLALLEVPDLYAPPIALAKPQAESTVTIGIGPDDAVTAAILRLVDVRIEAVRSTERISRLGFEFDRTVDLGDSGAGVYNARGELVGVVFGRSTTRADRSFAVRTSEIEQFLRQDTQKFVCSPAEDRVVSAE